MQINLKNDDTTASSGQSSNSQMNKLGKPKDKSRKLSKVRSRHLTADKRSRMKQEEDENREENKSMIEEEKKLCTDNNQFQEEIREYKPSQKDNSYFFSELEKDVEDEEQEQEPENEEGEDYAEENEELDDDDEEDNRVYPDQSNWYDQEINEDEDEDDEFTRELKVNTYKSLPFKTIHIFVLLMLLL